MYNLDLRIMNEVNQCDYDPNMKSLIINNIKELMNSPLRYSDVREYIRQWNRDKIIMVWFPMKIFLQQKPYQTPIQIYLPKNFPYVPPLIYLEVSAGCGINNKNPNINVNTKEIKVNSMSYWNASTPMSNILTEIYNSFSKNFPIYRNTPNTINRPQNTFYNVLNSGVNQLANQVSNQGYNFNPGANFYNNPVNNNVIPQNSNVQIYNSNNNIYQNDPPEEQIKKIIINHFIEKNLQKIKEEKNKLSQQESRLKNYQNEFKTANDKIDNFMNNQGAIFNNCQNDINTLNNKIMELTQYNQSRQNEGLTKENFMNFIQISDTKTISLIAKEAFLEELLMFIKKAVEKNKIDFSDAVKVIRSNSRTLFETRYMREKRTSTNYMI